MDSLQLHTRKCCVNGPHVRDVNWHILACPRAKEGLGWTVRIGVEVTYSQMLMLSGLPGLGRRCTPFTICKTAEDCGGDLLAVDSLNLDRSPALCQAKLCILLPGVGLPRLNPSQVRIAPEKEEEPWDSETRVRKSWKRAGRGLSTWNDCTSLMVLNLLWGESTRALS